MVATASSLLMTSQTPSLASTRKRSLAGSKSTRRTSGTAVMRPPGATPAQSYRSASFKSKSPKARETARPQRTMHWPPNFAGPGMKTRQTPSKSTIPPLASIRRCSSGLLGLWSSDRGTATSWGPPAAMLLPPRQSTARESPTQATSNRQQPGVRDSLATDGSTWGYTSAKTIVEPSKTSCCRAFFRKSSSVSRQASRTACVRCSSASRGFAERQRCRFPGNCSTTWSTHMLPEWPSSTAKPAMR
mmetsp:Transcript_8927/g.24749  ORF Transcript_8927/g.24749 Transcript_8927/m.24749 type:complete len:245 (+) Transcript_8927:239-973(+)